MENKLIAEAGEVQLIPGRVLLIAGEAGLGKTKMVRKISSQNNKTVYCFPEGGGGYIPSQLANLPGARIMGVGRSLKPRQLVKVWQKEFEQNPFTVLVVDEVPISRALEFVRWMRAFCFRYKVAGILTRSLRHSNKTAVQKREVSGLGLRGLYSEVLSLLVIVSLGRSRGSETVLCWRAERESCEWHVGPVEQKFLL